MTKFFKFAAACAAVVCAFGANGETVSLASGGDLTAAVKAAQDGDVIELDAGTYTLTDVGVDLLVDKPVTIRGLGATPADVVVKPDTSTATHRFLSISNENAVVENVTFTGCNILDDDATTERRRSPMRLYAGTIRNCMIRDNVQLNHGTLEQFGGLVTGCSFTGNRSKSDSRDHSIGRGGALFQYDGVVSNCVFTGNYARNHGGAAVVYGGLMTHCTVTGNSIDRSGGSGVTLAGGTLANSFVAQNSISGVGGAGKGAVAIMNGELRDSTVCSNTAPVTACGGVFVAALSGNYLNTCECDSTVPRTMTGCRVFANTTSGEGAGVYLVSDATVDRCTIYGNRSTSEVGSGLRQTAGTVRNTIVFGNGIKSGYDADNVLKTGGSFIYSCTQPAVEGEGNTDANPLFTDLALDDISLRPGSPCIGMGRAADGVTACDMGAVPYRAGEGPVRCGFTVSQTELSAAGAVTLHGYADGADVSGLALKWDFDGDGVADATGAEVEFDVEQAGVYSITLWLEDGGGTRYAAYTRENIVSLKLAIAYVNPNGSNTPPYATPATGAHDLKDAIDSVAATEEKPGEIIVMDGTYQCPDAWYVVDKPLYVHSENGPEATILRGWKSGSTAADYRVLKVEHPKALVTGFTLENGNWNSAVNGDPGGSALRLVSGVVSNCVIRDSTGCDYGAGAHVCGGLLTHSTICGNTSYRSNNGTAGKAGGVYQVGGYVSHCVISNNTACNAEGGCGLYITAGTATCCRITGNYGYYRETTGGIGVFMSGGRVERCEITGNGVKDTGNTGSGGGVKMSKGELVNCLVAGNRTYGQAAGVYQTGGTVENCTITGNASINQSGSGLYIANGNAIARNNVIFGNGAGVAAEPICNLEYSSAKTFANNIVSPATKGTDNVDADPLFNNAAAGDYTLAAGSPAIDAATEQGINDDLLGNMRPKDGNGDGDARPDVGCYEASGADEGELRCSFELTESAGFDAVTSTFTAHVAGTGSTGELAYAWDFGDGVVRDGSATGPSATVEFTTCGKHTVSLTVTAAGGSSATYTMADAVSVGVSKAYVNETGSGIWPYATPETATNDLVEIFGSALLADGRTFEIEVDDGDYVVKDKWIVITGNVYLHSKNGPGNCRLVADTTRNATERKAICLNNPDAVVEGLTLDAFCWDGNLKGDQGGVVRISAGTMRNCVIQNSRGGNNGAAVDMTGGVLENSILRNNWSIGGNNSGVGYGGGVYLSSGSPVVRNTVISNNYTAASGGGIYCKAAGAVVTNCVIAYNRTSYSQTTPMNNTNRHGGGIYTEAAATFANCAIIGNHARGEGGAVYATAAAKFINCLIADNAANTTRPGVYMTKAGQFLNCTISGNGTNAVANAIACEITDKGATFKNNIVWGNADCATELSLASGATASNNCTEDPKFKNAAIGNYRLRNASPCINKGDDSVWSVESHPVDLDGNSRFYGRHVDIGCYEVAADAFMMFIR